MRPYKLPINLLIADDHQLITWNLERQVLEIVLPRPADADKIFAHSPRILSLLNPASITLNSGKRKRGRKSTADFADQERGNSPA